MGRESILTPDRIPFWDDRCFIVDDTIRTCIAVFLLYDCIITCDREIALFWTSQMSGASVLFFMIKYGTILYEVLCVIAFLPTMSSKGCDVLVRFAAFIENLRFLPLAAFAAMRGYALTRSWAITTIIFTLSLIPLVINMIQYGLGVRGVLDSIIGCGEDMESTPTEAIMFPIASRAGLIIADFLLVVVTWLTLAAGPLRPRFRVRSSRSLTDIMLWNGMSYFSILTILNVLHLAFSVADVARDGASSMSYITLVIDPLLAVLVCRFLLDLQDASRRNIKLGTDDALHCSTLDEQASLSFARVLGSGATIIPIDEPSRSVAGSLSEAEVEGETHPSYDDARAALYRLDG
ncbi:hypothetical protein K466DRAFT_559142 [Polyporus arcularius HHB13444]|uniref:DUF6533 domain-containing protein n=1 Tax=Polyporus arcularius HHB13444 TaxID=1314778 RepID=A0A5C3NSR4_9APHY|nr:hypothetical protein K466DRAFT_559142 [Polyporus arcularius HHB13444]